ncbi:MAG TPA: site-specific integrase, partial [Rhodopila sp.]|nr:site-specific integrase [Rhodopila sp.]
FPQPVRFLFYMLLYSMQRLSDVLAMTVNDIRQDPDGRLWIVWRQSKTAEPLEIPVERGCPLEPLLLERMQTRITYKQRGTGEEKVCNKIVVSPHNHPWSKRNAITAWDAAVANVDKDFGPADEAVKAQRHALRRTGIVRMAEQGATAAQIAPMSGHSIATCQKMIDYYLGKRASVALSAVQIMERARVEGRTPIFTRMREHERIKVSKTASSASDD